MYIKNLVHKAKRYIFNLNRKGKTVNLWAVWVRTAKLYKTVKKRCKIMNV